MNGTERNDALSTGIEALDRKLGGGIPPGTVAALSAQPASQSELFLYEFVGNHQTVYVSTIRRSDTVEAALETQNVDALEALAVDVENPLDDARRLLDDLPAAPHLVIDPVSVLEESDRGEYRKFLAELESYTSETGSVVLLHCLCDGNSPDQRRDTAHVADIVFELTTEADGQSVVNRLTVPKFRGGQSVEDVIKLDLSSELDVDRSRNIV